MLSANQDLQQLSDTYLHKKIFQTDSKLDVANPPSEIPSLDSLVDMSRPMKGLPTRSALRFTLTSDLDMTRDISNEGESGGRRRVGCDSSAEFGRGASQLVRDRSTVAERRKTIRQESRRTEMRPGVDIKVERKKRSVYN